MESKINDTMENLREVLSDGYNVDLDNKETFPKDVREQIRDTYYELWKKKIEWMKSHGKTKIEVTEDGVLSTPRE